MSPHNLDRECSYNASGEGAYLRTLRKGIRSMKVTFVFPHPFLGDLEVEAEVDLGHPPPLCSNPDSPAFYDIGDPAEVEILSILWGEIDLLHRSPPQEISKALLYSIEERALEFAESTLYNMERFEEGY